MLPRSGPGSRAALLFPPLERRGEESRDQVGPASGSLSVCFVYSSLLQPSHLCQAPFIRKDAFFQFRRSGRWGWPEWASGIGQASLVNKEPCVGDGKTFTRILPQWLKPQEKEGVISTALIAFKPLCRGKQYLSVFHQLPYTCLIHCYFVFLLEISCPGLVLKSKCHNVSWGCRLQLLLIKVDYAPWSAGSTTCQAW